MVDRKDFAGLIQVARILCVINAGLGRRADYEARIPAHDHAKENCQLTPFLNDTDRRSWPGRNRWRLPIGNHEGRFHQLDGIPTGHDLEGAGLDDAVHVAIQEGEVVET